jgi:hypothetical protein
MIMHVVTKTAHTSKAPFEVERLMEFIKTVATQTNNSDLLPNVSRGCHFK